MSFIFNFFPRSFFAHFIIGVKLILYILTYRYSSSSSEFYFRQGYEIALYAWLARQCIALLCFALNQLVPPGSDGAELMDELKPSPHIRLDSKLLLSGNLQQIGSMEWIMYKPSWGAFYNTKLERHLQNLDVNTVVVCGCNFPNCPRSTIYEASERDYRIVLATDSTSVLYDSALQELKNVGVSIMNTDECVAWLRSLYYPKI